MMIVGDLEVPLLHHMHALFISSRKPALYWCCLFAARQLRLCACVRPVCVSRSRASGKGFVHGRVRLSHVTPRSHRTPLLASPSSAELEAARGLRLRFPSLLGFIAGRRRVMAADQSGLPTTTIPPPPSHPPYLHLPFHAEIRSVERRTTTTTDRGRHIRTPICIFFFPHKGVSP
ncbi:radial spoke protein 1 [Anopheles sinensis]|uniref:Radial spoke protein 1 n=1 Tax=Anopheles sinensis TaxID=74873 RepID=A0A084W7J1_ANOSI|nr:radial spoke protein 1 [Anopheles sinensis]